jgi:uncharacterized membrane protein YfbV (UPF0208 family)
VYVPAVFSCQFRTEDLLDPSISDKFLRALTIFRYTNDIQQYQAYFDAKLADARLVMMGEAKAAFEDGLSGTIKACEALKEDALKTFNETMERIATNATPVKAVVEKQAKERLAFSLKNAQSILDDYISKHSTE